MKKNYIIIEKASNVLSDAVRLEAGNKETSKIISELAEEISGKFLENNNIIIINIGELSKIVRDLEKFREDFLPFFQKLETFSKEFNKLVENLKYISDISNSIGEVAKHTNLVALNASIEAERAKEYGRGFAVVADEIRRMAVKTMELTKRINKFNSEILQNLETLADVLEIIDKIKEGTEVLSQDIDKIINISKTLDEISKEQEIIVHDIKGLKGLSLALEELNKMQSKFNKELGTLLIDLTSQLEEKKK
ncbi:methyl-accepting chemotaxis sensory transducer [Methanocaldococcus infernus ME]|uniref:Methyl-accepting chemotaxis sensory transducer n=1 Tax=Methanocaldococcus infernus (strain DSM 11812 / JCM 15783 / ME) TaxID=573063 RepID=D5VUA6_METIM|nr:methyl-accepting chemotaxis protein [Methanocaldococcus infernus]ADG12718.1 methyl-accepting chemotaxis sensory transducer [Methanocaldococcus infernus ME]